MAKATDVAVAVGARVRSRGRVGEVVSVDEERSLVTVRFDDARAVHRSGVRDEALSEADSVVGSAEVEVLPEPLPVERLTDVAPNGKAAVPTQAQITAARRAAVEAGRKEGLGAAKLLDVQDEAEAELVERMGRGEAA